MFNLSDLDLRKSFLGCGDGSASFNAELSAQGGQVVSVDPIYQFSQEEITSRIDTVYNEILDQVIQNKDDFIWDNIKSPAELGNKRMSTMKIFLDDYESGIKQDRYLGASLPHLPFQGGQFDVALCSHLLFLYSQHLNEKDHLLAIKALCRVAKEVRIYPLIDLDGEKSPYVDFITPQILATGKEVSLVPVDYRFQKGADQMLVIR